MTYQPHNPGYSGPQPPAGYGAPAVRPPGVPAEGPSKLPVFLAGAVAVLGFFAYLASFGPLFNINTNMGPFGGAELTASGMGYWTMAALIAALLAAVGLVAKGTRYTPVVAVTALLGLLLVIGQVVNRPQQVSVGWALWLVLLLTLGQAGAAVGALLVENGVIAAPARRPRYDAYGPYAGPPAGYYGQPGATGPQAPPQTSGYPGPIRVVAIPRADTGSRTTARKPRRPASPASDSSRRPRHRASRRRPSPPARRRPDRAVLT